MLLVWFVALGRAVTGLMKRVDLGVGEALQRFTARSRRACPVCKRRKLAQLETALWTGIPGTFVCHTYRCRGCGAELFAERDGPAMTMADHAVWRDAKEMRLLEAGRSELPAAVVRRGKRPRPGPE